MLSFSLPFACNLKIPLTFSKSYGKMKYILKAIAEWFATWNNNTVNFLPESIFQMLKWSKQAKYKKKSQEENAGTEVVLQVRGFCAVGGRTMLGKQVCSKYHSVHCKGSAENQLIYKDTGKHACPSVEGTERMKRTEQQEERNWNSTMKKN